MFDALERVCVLYDFYKELLTQRQTSMFESYYIYNVSLGEIAQNEGISKQAVKDALDKAIANMEKYEQALKLVYKHSKFVALKNNKQNLSLENYVEQLENLCEE